MARTRTRSASEDVQEEAADLTREEQEALEDGQALAEKYVAEQEARADDDPLVLAKQAAAEAAEENAAADEERAKAAEAEEE
jgi:hypothetical protein